MITQDTYYGRSQAISQGSDITLGFGYRLNILTLTAVGLSVTVPDARKLKKGRPCIVISKQGGNAFAVKDNTGGVLVASLTTTQVLMMSLIDNSTQAGTWLLITRTRLT